MDFLHRNATNQPQAQKDGTASFNAIGGNKFKQAVGDPGWVRIMLTILLFSITALAIAIALLLYFGKTKEDAYVNDKQIQAVFLSNGETYFGKITNITGQYVNLQAIYYLNRQQSTDPAQAQQQNANFSLVKLGCELHGPADQMIINRDQVSYWENLRSDGKVAKAISEWQRQNPNGQTCKTTTDSTQQSQSTDKQ